MNETKDFQERVLKVNEQLAELLKANDLTIIGELSIGTNGIFPRVRFADTKTETKQVEEKQTEQIEAPKEEAQEVQATEQFTYAQGQIVLDVWP